VIVSQESQIAYAFLSDRFKALGKLAFLRKGSPLPDTVTRRFNADPDKVLYGKRDCENTNLADWFDGPRRIALDEQVIGLGRYGYTLAVLSSEGGRRS
jgi:hypothetical protein